jgi:hypothetical protein
MKVFAAFLLCITFCLTICGQEVKELKFIDYLEKNINQINIYRAYFTSFQIDEDSLISIIQKSNMLYKIDTFILHKQIVFDSIGRKTNIRHIFSNNNTVFCETEIKYVDSEKYFVINKNPYVFYISDKPEIYSKIVSESYLYYSCGDLYKHFVIYENGSSAYKIILYYPLKNYSVIVKFYVNRKLVYIDFYEFIYKGKK